MLVHNWTNIYLHVKNVQCSCACYLKIQILCSNTFLGYWDFTFQNNNFLQISSFPLLNYYSIPFFAATAVILNFSFISCNWQTAFLSVSKAATDIDRKILFHISDIF